MFRVRHWIWTGTAPALGSPCIFRIIRGEVIVLGKFKNEGYKERQDGDGNGEALTLHYTHRLSADPMQWGMGTSHSLGEKKNKAQGDILGL